jgi:hypothetical protein
MLGRAAEPSDHDELGAAGHPWTVTLTAK